MASCFNLRRCELDGSALDVAGAGEWKKSLGSGVVEHREA
jgi:hypothetical protein